MANGTAPYRRAPTGLCDDASGNFFFFYDKVFRTIEKTVPLFTTVNRPDYAMMLQATIYGKAYWTSSKRYSI
jgi:hypothetical protein